LGYQVTASGDYTILKVLDYIDPNFDIVLEDTMLGVMTDLRSGDYTFNVPSPIEDNERFILHYNYRGALSTEDAIQNSNNISAYFLDDLLISKTENNIVPDKVQLYDISGKDILNVNFKENIFLPKLSSGIYLVKYSFENSSTITKKVIKR
jgi:hypothetical protein